MITDAERQTIKEFASGKSYHSPLRDAVEAIYKREVRTMDHSDLAMNFLSEVFNPCPDLMLRATYRRIVAGNH